MKIKIQPLKNKMRQITILFLLAFIALTGKGIYHLNGKTKPEESKQVEQSTIPYNSFESLYNHFISLIQNVDYKKIIEEIWNHKQIQDIVSVFTQVYQYVITSQLYLLIRQMIHWIVTIWNQLVPKLKIEL